MTDTPLLTERRDYYLDVTFNRPAVRNALNDHLVQSLTELLHNIKDDRSIRAVVLQGAGDHFCAGADIREAITAIGAPLVDGVDPLVKMNRKYGAMLEALVSAPQVIVSVARGSVMGGGVGILCASDVVLADPTFKARLSECSLGVPPAQLSPFLVEKVGLGVAKQWVLRALEFDVTTAKDGGLVNEVAADVHALMALRNSVLTQIGKNAPGALGVSKALLVASRPSYGALLDRAALAFRDALRGVDGQTGEGARGFSAFASKQSPDWVKTP